MTKLCIYCVLTLSVFTSKAQFQDHFSNNDYTHDPVWQGDPSDFVVNENHQLQSANMIANSMFQIITQSELAVDAQWEFWVKLAFNPSSVNYVDVWLISTSDVLSDNRNSGYFVRLGGSEDNISLYRKPASGPAELIIKGLPGILNASSSAVRIKVLRTAIHKWILLRDMTGGEDSYRSEGEIVDSSVQASSFFGVMIRQSTPSFFGKHFFDDFVVRRMEKLPTALQVASVKAMGKHTVEIIFDNPLQVASAEDVLNYHVNTLGTPVSAAVDPVNGRVVRLAFDREMEANTENTIIIDGVSDVFDNEIKELMSAFTYFQASRYDVVINEMFADPSPQIGLPPYKFIELKNVSAFPVNLMNWQLKDGRNTATLPAFELLPDSFLIVTTVSGLDAYRTYGPAIAVTGFPSLNISEGEISLYNDAGAAIHAMRYDLTTYGNELKKEGGFSLEMINPKLGCVLEGNWIASHDASGGTPGRKNSVDGEDPASFPINIRSVYVEGRDTLMLILSKPVDSTSAVNSENYMISGGLITRSIEVMPPFFDRIKIAFSSLLSVDQIYKAELKGLADCANNLPGSKITARFGVFGNPSTGDIVINEILSYPKTSGAEFVELYNNSDRVFDMSRLYIANRNATGQIASVTAVSDVTASFLPGDFLLLTKDQSSVVSGYSFTDADAIVQMKILPSFPNDRGFVVVLNQQGDILDEVHYDAAWHFPLIRDRKGVSLERISYTGPSDATNFHSASEDAGYATPGIKNSQSSNRNIDPEVDFKVIPEVFSPDNDGRDDFVTIHYSFGTTGYITNIKIFDASGRMVRYLQKNSISGLSGYYRWDGLDDRNQKLSQGIYVIYAESFDEDGHRVIHKKTVVLAKHF